MYNIYDRDIMGMNHNIIKTISSSYVLGPVDVCLDESMLAGHLIDQNQKNAFPPI